MRYMAWQFRKSVANVQAIYLVQVERVDPNASHGSIAVVRPLYESTEDRLFWERPINANEARHEFPNRGLVTWFNPPDEASIGSLWQVAIDARLNFHDDNPHHDGSRVTITG